MILLRLPLSILPALPTLNADGKLLFVTRCLRMFAYGFVSILLMLYLRAVGLSEQRIGWLVSLTLAGDTVISLWLTTRADRFGRKRTLLIGAALMLAAGAVFAFTGSFWPLLIAATIGVISPNGKEVGPFLPVEQAALSQVIESRQRTAVFAWYALVGALAAAIGNQGGGVIAQFLQKHGFSDVQSYRSVILVYAAIGAVLAILFARLSGAAEVTNDNNTAKSPVKLFLGLHRSKRIVMKLSALFALDAFAGGFVMDAFLAYWFHVRWNVDLASLGMIFLGANFFAAMSALVAAKMAERFGLINTMVFTHLPSNALMVIVPLMPNVWLAVAALWLRFSISQMDVPTRQSYTMAVVDPDERSAASGVTGVARSVGAMLSPLLVGWCFARPSLINLPLYLAGGLKIVYDLLLYRSFITLRPPEETPTT